VVLVVDFADIGDGKEGKGRRGGEMGIGKDRVNGRKGMGSGEWEGAMGIVQLPTLS